MLPPSPGAGPAAGRVTPAAPFRAFDRPQPLGQPGMELPHDARRRLSGLPEPSPAADRHGARPLAGPGRASHGPLREDRLPGARRRRGRHPFPYPSRDPDLGPRSGPSEPDRRHPRTAPAHRERSWCERRRRRHPALGRSGRGLQAALFGGFSVEYWESEFETRRPMVGAVLRMGTRARGASGEVSGIREWFEGGGGRTGSGPRADGAQAS